jgi:hypothetical protein
LGRQATLSRSMALRVVIISQIEFHDRCSTYVQSIEQSGATDYLNGIARRLNQRPRKTLGFETPADRLQAVLH